MELELRRVATDSSSIILLQKSLLLDRFLSSYHAIVAEEVYTELTMVPKKGSVILKQLLQSRVTAAGDEIDHPKMGKGESATIGLYQAGLCDFILLDDRRAANYCRTFKIPFINSLLISRILCLCGAIDEDEAEMSMALLHQKGYYSAAIISQAETIADSELKKFYPH